MSVINESFKSDAIRTLTHINSNEHIDLRGRAVNALSPIGSAFLMSMPVLWDKLSDGHISIIGDEDIFSSIPMKDVESGGESLNNRVETGMSDDRRARKNLPSMIDNYGEFYKNSKKWHELSVRLSVVRNADKAPSKGTVARYAWVTKDERMIKQLAAINELILRMRTVSKGNTDKETIEKRLNVIGDYSNIMAQLDQKNAAALDELITAFKKDYKLSSLRHTERVRDDEFTQYDDARSLVLPTVVEFIDRCINNGIITDSDASGVVADRENGNVFMDRRKSRRIINHLCRNRKDELYSNYGGAPTDEEVAKIKEEVEGVFNALRSEYNKIVVPKGDKNYRGVTGEKTASAESYELLSSLYRRMTKVAGKSAQLVNTIDDAIFEKNYDDEFKIFVLTDENFKILYVLSYYAPIPDNYLMHKSPSAGCLYGWGIGDNIDPVLRRLHNRKPILRSKNGIEYYDYGYSKYNTSVLKGDDNIRIAIVIHGDDSLMDDDKGSLAWSIYGNFAGPVLKGSVGGVVSRYTESEDGAKKLLVMPSSVVQKKVDSISASDDIQSQIDDIEAYIASLDHAKMPDSIKARTKQTLEGELEELRKKLAEQKSDKNKQTEVTSAMMKGLFNKLRHTNPENVTMQNGTITINITNDIEKEVYEDMIADLSESNGIDPEVISQYLSPFEKYGKVYDDFRLNNVGLKPDFVESYKDCAMVMFDITEEEFKKYSVKNVSSYTPTEYDNDFVITYYERTGNEEYETLLTTGFINEDGEFEVDENAPGQSWNKKDDSKNGGYRMTVQHLKKNKFGLPKEQIAGRVYELKKAIVWYMGKMVEQFVTEQISTAIDDINEYITPRCGFLKMAFDNATNGGVLMQHFNGRMSLEFTRKSKYSGINPETGDGDASTAKKYARASELNDIAKQNAENRAEYEKSLEETHKELQEISGSVPGEKDSVKLWDMLADRGSEFVSSFPRSFYGYEHFFRKTGSDRRIDAIFKRLLNQVYRLMIDDSGLSDDDMYDVYAQYVQLIVDVVNDFAPIKAIPDKQVRKDASDAEVQASVDGKLEVMANAVAKMYSDYNGYISEMNQKYGLQIESEL